jgi:hypothetical protein
MLFKGEKEVQKTLMPLKGEQKAEKNLMPPKGEREVHCCKSSERFGLKCEFSLVSNKYIPYIGLV